MSGDIQSAIIGAAAGCIGVLIGALAQRTLEMKRWKQMRLDELRREIRGITGELAGSVAEFVHLMLWYTYFIPDSGKPSSEFVEQYKSESHRLIGRVIGARVKLAALDVKTHGRLKPLVDKAIDLSERIDTATGVTGTEAELPKDESVSLNEDATRLMDELYGTMKALFEDHVNAE